MPRQLTPDELAAIEDEIVSKAPQGLRDDEFDRFFGPRFAQAKAIAENTPTPLQGSALRRALGGLWETLNPVTIAKGAYSSVRHPLDTAANIGQAHLDQARKAWNAPSIPEALGHGLATVLPVIGPAAANVGEQIVETGDVAGGVGRGAGLVAPFGAGPLYRGVKRAVTKAGAQAPGASRLADAADASASRRMTDVIAPKVGANKTRFGNMADDVSGQLAREKGLGAFSREGLHVKVQTKLQEAEAGLDAAANARLVSQQVKTGPLLTKLDEQIAAKTAYPVEASKVTPTKTNLNAAGQETVLTRTKPEAFGKAVEPGPNTAELTTLKRIRSEIARLGEVAPYESVRRIRDSWDKVAKVKYMPSNAADVLKAQGDSVGAYKGTSAIREALAATDKNTATANQVYSLYKTADDVMTATAEAERVRPKVGRGLIRTGAGAVAGGVTGGGVGAAIGATVGAIVNRAIEAAPTLQIVIARRLAAAADAIRRGQMGQAETILQRIERQLGPSVGDVVKAGAQTGRVLESAPTVVEDRRHEAPASVQR